MTVHELDGLKTLIERLQAELDYALAHGLIALEKGDTVTYNRSLKRALVTSQLYNSLEALLEIEMHDTLDQGLAQ